MSNNENNWKSPAIIIALVGLLVSICTNFYQYVSAENKLELERSQWQAELNLSQEKWNLEKKKLEQEIKEDGTQSVNKDSLRTELVNVKRDINVWEDAIFKDNGELIMMKNKLPQIKEEIMREAHQRNITLQEQMISTKERELESSRKRRQEIEEMLNN